MSVFKSQRHFSASPNEIFAAIESPESLAKWWGPAGFRCEFEIFEFQAQGEWKFTMIGPDGTEYLNLSRFVSITKPSQVVIRHDCQPFFTVTLDIAPNDSGSILDFVQEFDDPDILPKILPIIQPANEQLFDKLEQILIGNPSV